METLSKDILIKTALELSPADLVNFCLTEKKKYEIFCNSKDFWRLKLQKDYPNIFKKSIQNPKNVYMKKFTFVSKKLEELSIYILKNVLNSFFVTDFIKFIDKEKYLKYIYDKLYLNYNQINFETLSKYDDEEIEDYLKYFSYEIINDIIPTVLGNYDDQNFYDDLNFNIRKYYYDLIEDKLEN